VAEQFLATTPQELATRDELLSMSGLEFMQGMRDGKVARPPISGLLSYAVHTVEPGRVTFRGTPNFHHTNPMGTVHGGWYGTLLDSAMGCAVMTTVPKGSIYTTLEYKINIVRAIPLDMEIEASAEVQHAGRSTGVANGWIKGVEDGRLYATSSTTCMIMKAT
jgi:uncharacterized protein (TIGR00369 family)